MKIEINIDQYATIKALHAVTSKGEFRLALQNVRYNAKEKRLEACDGHILRLESMELPSEENLYFRPEDCVLSVAQLKKIHGKALLNTGFDFEVSCETEKENGNEYPRIENVIPKIKERSDLRSLDLIGFDFAKFAQFQSSFLTKPAALTLCFGGDLKAVMVYHKAEFKGVIMPCRIVDYPAFENDSDTTQETSGKVAA